MREGWGNYANISPILFPRRMMGAWRGNYLPLKRGKAFDDLYCKDPDDFNVDKPVTDYERVWASQEKAGIPPVHSLVVDDAAALLFSTYYDYIKWWPEQRMLVSGYGMPEPEKLPRVEWKTLLAWRPSETEYVIMNPWDHGANPEKDLPFSVELERNEYEIQNGSYGWDEDKFVAELFRFVPKGSV